MKPVPRGCQRLPKLLSLNLRPVCRRHYSFSFQPQTLRTSASAIVSRAHPNDIAMRKASTMASEPQFAEGINADQLLPSLNELQGQGWGLDEGRIGIKKTFYFRSYFKAVSFVNVIASQSATKKHHATMTVRIGSVDVHWTTHNPRGLTDKDVSMAQFCEQASELMGAVQEGQGQKCGPGA
ncbi:transcriptional coactivator/pterin dehydratase [Aspergillus varians]